MDNWKILKKGRLIPMEIIERGAHILKRNSIFDVAEQGKII